MQLEMFANELSFIPPARDVRTGQERVRNFVMTMRKATVNGAQRTINLPADFFSAPIAPMYFWQNWLNDNRVEREVRQFFLSLSTKLPFLVDHESLQASWANIDCLWENQSALGLKAAYLADGLAISILSRPEWDTHLVECEICEIIDEVVTSHLDSIHHASSESHLELQNDWVRQRLVANVENGRELWQRMEQFFPSLLCCDSVEAQMVNLPTQSLASVMRGLFYLNSFSSSWQTGAFDPAQIRCSVSPESQATLERPQFAAEHTVRCPDGIYRVFSWHAKLGNSRIYFAPDLGPGRLIIGHLGHFNTVRYH